MARAPRGRYHPPASTTVSASRGARTPSDWDSAMRSRISASASSVRIAAWAGSRDHPSSEVRLDRGAARAGRRHHDLGGELHRGRSHHDGVAPVCEGARPVGATVDHARGIMEHPSRIGDRRTCRKGRPFVRSVPEGRSSPVTRSKGIAVRIDDIDRRIMRELQRDAARSLEEIARAVGSSKTPVWNRIRKLRAAGIVGATTVTLDAQALGFEACFFVLVRTSDHGADWQAAFLRGDRGAAGGPGGPPPGGGRGLHPEGPGRQRAGPTTPSTRRSSRRCG